MWQIFCMRICCKGYSETSTDANRGEGRGLHLNAVWGIKQWVGDGVELSFRKRQPLRSTCLHNLSTSTAQLCTDRGRLRPALVCSMSASLCLITTAAPTHKNIPLPLFLSEASVDSISFHVAQHVHVVVSLPSPLSVYLAVFRCMCFTASSSGAMRANVTLVGVALVNSWSSV